jgi:hypothetical protein
VKKLVRVVEVAAEEERDGNVEYTPSSGIFHSARNNLRRCFPACTVCMQVFNIAQLNISVI